MSYFHSDDSDTEAFSPRKFSELSLHATAIPDDDCDLIEFLAVLQKFDVAMAALTWQAVLDPIGGGATGTVNEAMMTLNISLAFKRVSKRQKQSVDRKRIFQTLITEVTLLSHPAVHKHPNVAELEGVCWEVETDRTVWPVLIFEKSQFGDLMDFFTSPIGRALSLSARREMCRDVAVALADMHANNIIHGDLKPENVLVFREPSTERYIAKVIDFGFSTRFSGDEDLLYMPKSEPWIAPEHTYDPVTPKVARAMDIFSLGMLCLWMLFEKPISSGSFPEVSEELTPNDNEKRNYYFVLKSYKEKNRLTELLQLLGDSTALVDDERSTLDKFFRVTISERPEQREADSRALCNLLDNTLQSSPPTVALGSVDDSSDYAAFHLQRAIYSLYDADVLVRKTIRDQLEERVSKTRLKPDPTSFDVCVLEQLLICYHVGFGGPRDEQKIQKCLEETGEIWKANSTAGASLILHRVREDIMDARHRLFVEDLRNMRAHPIAQFHEPGYLDGSEGGGSLYRRLIESGRSSRPDHISEYRMGNRIEEALNEIRREAEDIAFVFGKESILWIDIAATLLVLFSETGRALEQEQLATEVYEITMKTLGEEHPYTLTSGLHLTDVHRKFGRLAEAETLGTKQLEVRKKVLGIEHRNTLAGMEDLALTYEEQGRLQEAESLWREALATSNRTLGPKHTDTAVQMELLAYVLEDQGRYEEAEALALKVLDVETEMLGATHSRTIGAMGHLASIYLAQGSPHEAEKIEAQLLETCQRSYGMSHPYTLSRMNGLAMAHQEQGRYDEASNLYQKIIFGFSQMYGPKHRSTAKATANYATALCDQGKWAEAEPLYIQAIETQSRTLGPENPDTLSSMHNLASTYIEMALALKPEILGLLVFLSDDSTAADESRNIDDANRTLHELRTIFTEYISKAETLETQATQASERMGASAYPENFVRLESLSKIYEEQGRDSEAESLAVHVLELRQKVLGPKHPETLVSLQNHALRLIGRGEHAEGIKVAEGVTSTMRESLGEDHPSTLRSLETLAGVLMASGRLEEARNTMEESLGLHVKRYGLEDEDTMRSRRVLESIKAAMTNHPPLSRI